MTENIGITRETRKSIIRLIGDLSHIGTRLAHEISNNLNPLSTPNMPLASNQLHMQYLRFRHNVTYLPQGERDFIERIITPEYEKTAKTPTLFEWCVNNTPLSLYDAQRTIGWAATGLILMNDNRQSLMRYFMMAANSVDLYNTAYALLLAQNKYATNPSEKPNQHLLLEAHLTAKKHRTRLSNTFDMLTKQDKDKLDENLAYVMEDRVSPPARELLNSAIGLARISDNPALAAQGGTYLYQASLLQWPQIAEFKRQQLGYY